jgi:hypothetical protein
MSKLLSDPSDKSQRTRVAFSTRHINSMAYGHEGAGASWTAQDEKDMQEASAQNAHVAFEEAFRCASHGLRNKPSEQDWAGAFGFNPAVSEKQRHFMGAALGRKRSGTSRKGDPHMSASQLSDYARK